jgi:hypothetical protein
MMEIRIGDLFSRVGVGDVTGILSKATIRLKAIILKSIMLSNLFKVVRSGAGVPAEGMHKADRAARLEDKWEGGLAPEMLAALVREARAKKIQVAQLGKLAQVLASHVTDSTAVEVQPSQRAEASQIIQTIVCHTCSRNGGNWSNDQRSRSLQMVHGAE